MSTLFAELKRRNVLRVAAAYAVVAWILIEAGSVLMPTFGASERAFQAYVILVIVGFLVSLVFAWVFELTPEGVKLERNVDRGRSITEATGRKLNFAIIGLLVIALGISVTLNVTGMRHLGAIDKRSSNRLAIAVLPFTSLSSDPDNVVFADGMHDDLLTRLANVAALKVISRTSVMEYRSTTKNLREIAEELGVGTVLEGTVQRMGDSVRINTQLIDAQTDEHLWAESYNRELSAKNIFAIQSEISTEITDALEATLSEEERGRLAEVPTDNFAAYNLYMQGRVNLYLRTLDSTQQARENFEQAIDLDPGYADAYAGLSDSMLLLFINHGAVPGAEAFSRSREALTKALEINPHLADAYASLGLLHTTIWLQTRFGTDNVEAESAFKRAIALNPNHARAIMWFASLRASEEKFDEAIELYNRSLDLDPRARIPYANLPGLYATKGYNDKALQYWLKAIDIHPEWPTVYQNVAIHLQGLGRIDEAVAWSVKTRELSSDPLNGLNIIGAYIELGEREKAAEFMQALEIPEQHPLFSFGQGFPNLFRGDYSGAVAVFEASLAKTDNVLPFMFDILSDAAMLAGDYEKAYEYAIMRYPALADLDNLIVDRFNVGDVVKLAYLKQQEGDMDTADALLEAAMPVVRDTPRLGMAGHGIRDVQILTLQGRTGEALDILQEAIDQGFRGTVFFDTWSLGEDPYLLPIRENSRYESMIAQIQAYIDVMSENVRQAQLFDSWDELRARASSAVL